MNKFKACATALLAAFLFSALLSSSSVSADQGSAQGAITQAKAALKTSFNAVQQAESAGANVESLTATLNDAAQQLSMADLAYQARDYDGAYNYAAQSQSKLSGFTDQASALQQQAAAASSLNSLLTILSVVAAAAILGAGVAVWVTASRKTGRNTHGST